MGLVYSISRLQYAGWRRCALGVAFCIVPLRVGMDMDILIIAGFLVRYGVQ
jgi:hypothetical protein